MTQYARPSSDITVENWVPSTGATLYACINETSANDSPSISRTGSSETGYGEVGLSSVTDPEVHTGHVLSYRCRRNPTNRSITFVARLMQGATEIASWTHTDEPDALTTYNQNLSEAQAGNITNYAALSVRLDITALQNNQAGYYVSWVQLAVPDYVEQSSSSSSRSSSSSSSSKSSSSSSSKSSSSKSSSSSSSSLSSSSSRSSSKSSSSSSRSSSSSSSKSSSSSSSKSSSSKSSSSSSSRSSSSSSSRSSSSSSKSSSSAAVALSGTVVWGHITGVEEDNIRTFNGNWTGTASIVGSGDSEEIRLNVGENEESETWNIGIGDTTIIRNKYAAGVGTPIVKYKTGDSKVNCEAVASWTTYVGSFTSLGWVKIRIEYPV